MDVAGRISTSAGSTPPVIAAERSLICCRPFIRPRQGASRPMRSSCSARCRFRCGVCADRHGLGIGGLIAVRDLLGCRRKSSSLCRGGSPGEAQSFAAGRIVQGNSAATFADGMACRDPDPDAFAIIARGASRIITVSEDESAAAIRALYADTHKWRRKEGARARVAALLRMARKCAGVAWASPEPAAISTRGRLAMVLAGDTATVNGSRALREPWRGRSCRYRRR